MVVFFQSNLNGIKFFVYKSRNVVYQIGQDLHDLSLIAMKNIGNSEINCQLELRLLSMCCWLHRLNGFTQQVEQGKGLLVEFELPCIEF